MNDINPDISPWYFHQGQARCQFCQKDYQFHINHLDSHAGDCAWRQAFEARGQAIPESNTRNAMRRFLLLEENQQ